uniref:zona pellucida sperm-binding protein 3-like n=1 Tax=Pristiophorus japonicus TaxID=55135 RepID=UPI00398F8C5D
MGQLVKGLVVLLILVRAVCSSDTWQQFRNWDFPWSIEKATRVPPGAGFASHFSVSEGRSVSPLQTVMVQCGEQNFLVRVQMDLFGTRHLIKAADLILGTAGCRPTGIYLQNSTVLFDYGLHECGSTVKMTVDLLIYTTHLYYKPSPIGGVIVRTNSAVVPIECHYLRKRMVSSNAIEPTWVPFSSTKGAEGRLSFSLHLMTDDWSAQRASNIYHLGDLIHIEASVVTVSHMPLRLYIDRCVATLSSDQDSTPRYHIIDFNGCLLDSQGEDSFSSFVSHRDHRDKLQFNLDAFRFFEDARDLIFISCHLKVIAADQSPDSVNKACSFQKPANHWSLVNELDLSMVQGSNEVCACCDGGNCRAPRLQSGGRPHSRDRREVLSEQGDLGSEVLLVMAVILAAGALISAGLVAFLLSRKHN